MATDMSIHLPDPEVPVLRQVQHAAGAGRWRTEAMRAHAAPRLLWMTKGQGRITVAGLTSGYGPNNLIYLPPGTMYGYETGPTVHGLAIAMPPSMAGEWPDGPLHLRLRDVGTQKEFGQHLDALERELAMAAAAADPDVAARHARAARHYLGLLAVTVERVADARSTPDDVRADGMAARIAAAYTDLVERDFRSRAGVAGYAAALGITPTHLTRCCRQSCGRSALGILNDRILYEARVLLRDTATPVKGIASSLGFASAAYFTRSFQAATGQTPSAFRRGTDTPRG